MWFGWSLRPNLWNKTLAMGTWNVTCRGKEPLLGSPPSKAWVLEPIRGTGPSTTATLRVNGSLLIAPQLCWSSPS